MPARTALDLLREKPLKTLSLGCPIIDEAIGRMPCRGISEISGEAGAGKTQVCLSMALQSIFNADQTAIDGSVAYITCGEGMFPLKRLSQMALQYESVTHRITLSDILSHIHIEHCMNSEAVAETVSRRIPEMCRKETVKLLIIDSLAGMIRFEYDAMKANEMRERTSFVFGFARHLKWLSDIFDLGILVVNQVTSAGLGGTNEMLYSAVRTPQSIPALGLTWATCVSHRYVISKSDFSHRYVISKSDFSLSTTSHYDMTGTVDQQQQLPARQYRRMLELVSSPLYPPAACFFYIDGTGLHGL